MCVGTEWSLLVQSLQYISTVQYLVMVLLNDLDFSSEVQIQ